VPSAIVLRESNYMLNPYHNRFSEVDVGAPLAFEFDVRLLGKLG